VVFGPDSFISNAESSRIHVLFGHAGSNDYTIGKAYWGRSALDWGGNNYDYGETPTQILFGGSAGTTITADTRSDEFDFTFVDGATYVLSVYLSAGTNYKHSDATTLEPDSYTHASSGDYAADLTWSGSPAEELGTIYFAQDVVENDYLVVQWNLFHLELESGTPPSLLATLPAVLFSAEAYGHSMFTEYPAEISFPMLHAASGVRCFLNHQTLPLLALSASMGAQASETLNLPFPELEATGVIGSGATLSKVVGFPTLVTAMGWRQEAKLPAMSLDISAQGEAAVGMDQSLPAFQLFAQGDTFRADLAKRLFFPDFEASMLGLTDGLSKVLGFPELSATGRADYMSVDADLFRLDLSGSVQGDENGVNEVLGMLEIAAAGSAGYVRLVSNLLRLDLSSSMVGLTDGLDLALIFPDLLAQGGRASWTEATLPHMELAAQAGERATLARALPQLALTATATHITVGVDRPLFVFEITAAGYTGNAALAADLPWVRVYATAISGFAATLDQILSSPSLEASVLLTPLVWLDTELAPVLMDSQVNGADDGVLPGAVLTDPSRWEVTVLRHSRW
jgi:hypothetical protein